MTKGIILALGILTVGCSKKEAQSYICMTPAGPITVEAKEGNRKGDSVIAQLEDADLEIPFIDCIGIKKK